MTDETFPVNVNGAIWSTKVPPKSTGLNSKSMHSAQGGTPNLGQCKSRRGNTPEEKPGGSMGVANAAPSFSLQESQASGEGGASIASA